MNRDQVRKALMDAGKQPSTVTREDLMRLRRIINKHLRQSGIYNGTAKLTRAKQDLRFIEMRTEEWTCREAVSFNTDGFIGIAGWADSNNVKPILSALLEWAGQS